jgi:hypothetical protein
MQNVRRRLQALERLPEFQPPPSPLEQLRSLALQSLSQQDLDLLRAMVLEQAEEMQPRELTEREAAECNHWCTALAAEARRMGFKSLAEAEWTARQRR